MNDEQPSPHAVVLRRSLEGGKAFSRVECLPGMLTVLTDESGGSMPAYEAAVCGKESLDRVVIERGQEPFPTNAQLLIGFKDVLPDDKRLKEYLIEHGYAAETIDQLIADFELDKFTYLPCSHLPQVQARQVLLMAAMKSSVEFLVLNDPFLPFNGRWREEYARMVLEDCKSRQRTVLCTNLSFIPKCWSTAPQLLCIDVGLVAQTAVQEYRGELELLTKQAQAVAKKEEAAAESGPLGQKKPIFELPPNMVFAYREARDFIVEPLETAARFLRSFSGLLAVGSFTVLIMLMGFVMFPKLGDYREKLARLAERHQYATLGDWLKSLGKGDVVSVPAAEKDRPVALSEAGLDEEEVLELISMPECFLCSHAEDPERNTAFDSPGPDSMPTIMRWVEGEFGIENAVYLESEDPSLAATPLVPETVALPPEPAAAPLEEPLPPAEAPVGDDQPADNIG